MNGNTASNNDYGISLKDSLKNNLTGNVMVSNTLRNLYIPEKQAEYPYEVYKYDNNIDQSNTVNGKPVYYFYNVHGTNENPERIEDREIGHLTLANCTYFIIRNNTLNNGDGIYLYLSSNNLIYNNYFNNTNNAYDDGNNIWNITKTAGTNIIGGPYLGGNYWSDYTGNDTDGDGLGDTPYDIPGGSNKDYLPLVVPVPLIFDTGFGTYPSIMGTHNGTITLLHNITVNKMYTYPRVGTGGHSEYARIWNSTLDVVARWDGYKEDWHNITFNETFVLYKNKTYNYTIRTGSYPQIIHADEWEAEGRMGIINCTSFVDANGKRYNNWIPAIKLFL